MRHISLLIKEPWRWSCIHNL